MDDNQLNRDSWIKFQKQLLWSTPKEDPLKESKDNYEHFVHQFAQRNIKSKTGKTSLAYKKAASTNSLLHNPTDSKSKHLTQNNNNNNIPSNNNTQNKNKNNSAYSKKNTNNNNNNTNDNHNNNNNRIAQINQNNQRGSLLEQFIDEELEEEEEDDVFSFTEDSLIEEAITGDEALERIFQNDDIKETLLGTQLTQSDRNDLDTIEDYLNKTFSWSYVIEKEEEERMEKILEKKTARAFFAWTLNQQRAKSMCIPTQNFRQFCLVIEIALNYVEEAEEFRIGKILMHMSSTFFRTIGSEQIHEFVQNSIKHLSLWTNSRFWAEALCDNILNERKKMAPSKKEFKELSKEEKESIVEYEKNLAFASIAGFSHSMLSFSVPTREIQNWMEKWALVYGLSPDQHQMLFLNLKQLLTEERTLMRKIQKEAWLMSRKEDWVRYRRNLIKGASRPQQGIELQSISISDETRKIEEKMEKEWNARQKRHEDKLKEKIKMFRESRRMQIQQDRIRKKKKQEEECEKRQTVIEIEKFPSIDHEDPLNNRLSLRMELQKVLQSSPDFSQVQKNNQWQTPSMSITKPNRATTAPPKPLSPLTRILSASSSTTQLLQKPVIHGLENAPLVIKPKNKRAKPSIIDHSSGPLKPDPNQKFTVLNNYDSGIIKNRNE